MRYLGNTYRGADKGMPHLKITPKILAVENGDKIRAELSNILKKLSNMTIRTVKKCKKMTSIIPKKSINMTSLKT